MYDHFLGPGMSLPDTMHPHLYNLGLGPKLLFLKFFRDRSSLLKLPAQGPERPLLRDTVSTCENSKTTVLCQPLITQSPGMLQRG